MTMREREGLIARIRQIRRVAGPQEKPAPVSTSSADAGPGDGADAARIDALQARVAHLEQLLEGLQDSVHRETERLDRTVAEIQAQIQPAAMGAALNKDARDRGL